MEQLNFCGPNIEPTAGPIAIAGKIFTNATNDMGTQ